MMTVDMEDLAIVVNSLRADHPNDYRAQRLAALAAEAHQVYAERNQALAQILNAEQLDPVLLHRYATDRSPAVRAVVWARTEWSLDEMKAMLDTERASQVRAAVLNRPGLPGAVVDQVMTPLNTTVAQRVLTNAEHLPAAAVLRAAVHVQDKPLVLHLADALRVPHVALAAANDSRLNPGLRVAALCSRSVPDRQVRDLLDQWKASWASHSHTGSEPFNVGDVLHELVGRPDLSLATLETVRRLYVKTVGTPTLIDELLHRRRLPAADRARHLRSDPTNLGMLRCFWAELPEADRTPEIARELVTMPGCDTTLLAEVSRYLPDASPAALANLVLDSDKVWLCSWMSEDPDLFVKAARVADNRHWVTNLLRLHPHLAEPLIEDLVASPSDRDDPLWEAVLNEGLVPDRLVQHTPLGHLIWHLAWSAADEDELRRIRSAAAASLLRLAGDEPDLDGAACRMAALTQAAPESSLATAVMAVLAAAQPVV